MTFGNIVIVKIVGGGDFNAPTSKSGFYKSIADQWNFAFDKRNTQGFSMKALITRIVGVYGDGDIA